MKSFVPVALAVALLSSGTLAVSHADACGMSVRLAPPKVKEAKPSPVLEVAAAERALEQDQPVVAARRIVAAFPSVRGEEAGRDPLGTRALRVLALAAVRADGDLALAGAQRWSRSANLQWALQSLREIDQKRPNDPALQADLGEALARMPHTQEEAFKVLDGLAKKDLMGSPHAYAALGRLRADRGDREGAALAVKRCEGMAQTPSVCAPPATSQGAVTPSKTAATSAPSAGLLAARN